VARISVVEDISSHTLAYHRAQVQPKNLPTEQKNMEILPDSLAFNTVITKLKAGKQIFSNTVITPDLEAAKEACEGQDFLWIEMQHSTMTWRETQQLIKVVAEAGCIPFVRVPSANIGDILKACDAGALGIVVPMVESVEEARNAVLFSKYPIGHRDYPHTKPWGRRSSGSNQATSLWGDGYATNANNNILVMIQIESPAGFPCGTRCFSASKPTSSRAFSRFRKRRLPHKCAGRSRVFAKYLKS
jgi:HpcH/HpaI aldolase/citrate lyase family